MEPTSSGHEALLFIHPRSPRNDSEFYKDTRFGEFWVGRRMTLEETETKYGIKVRQIESIEEFLKDKKEKLQGAEKVRQYLAEHKEAYDILYQQIKELIGLK